MRTRLPWTLSALLAMLILQACAVRRPSQDSTYPTVRWSVLNRSTGERKEYGEQTTTYIAAKLGDRFEVSLYAEDSEGLREISLESWTHTTCEYTVQPAQKNFSIVQNPPMDDKGNVMTGSFIMKEIEILHACSGGRLLTSGRTRLSGAGSNYFRMSALRYLEFSVAQAR